MEKGTDRYYEQAEFNMGVSYIIRLNMLLMSCVEASINLDIQKWYQCLWGLLSELSTRMSDDEYKTFEKKLIDMLPVINKTVNADSMTNIGGTTFIELKHIEKEIRAVIKRAGLETKLMESPERALK